MYWSVKICFTAVGPEDAKRVSKKAPGQPSNLIINYMTKSRYSKYDNLRKSCTTKKDSASKYPWWRCWPWNRLWKYRRWKRETTSTRLTSTGSISRLFPKCTESPQHIMLCASRGSRASCFTSIPGASGKRGVKRGNIWHRSKII